jgi:hypothetical protein
MLCIDREVSLYRFFSNLHATVPREVPLSSRLVLLRLPPRVSLTGGFVASSRGAGPSAEARRPPGGAPPLCCSEDEDEATRASHTRGRGVELLPHAAAQGSHVKDFASSWARVAAHVAGGEPSSSCAPLIFPCRTFSCHVDVRFECAFMFRIFKNNVPSFMCNVAK